MLAKSCCSELEQTLVDKEMMIGSMKSNVEERNGLVRSENLHSFDLKYHFAHPPSPFPSVPSMSFPTLCLY